jgi:DNA helicase-2/ATP-dependent DNA helicase PcrA
MEFVADLHIHSRFSRATSRELGFVGLHRAALEKGIDLVGTGDFTHPGWMADIRDQLDEAEPGLFRLKPELAREAEQGLPQACSGEVRFVLQVEISNIYKRDGKVRKNHNLVYLPSLEAADRFSEHLAAIGKLTSDGRPILGLDARDLLEITLECDEHSFLVPAHIWTPWFSMLGSKSGFDSLEDCFADLSEHIFAAETGLSSDPPMNWRVSELDRLTLVSNSDAHSLGTLGREANLLDIDLGFEPLRNALATREGFGGTIEFYPEEGKYHLDGHRKCGVRLEPEESRRLGGRCPECGGLLTVGVMSRVLDLADRPEGTRPDRAAEFERLVPLAETAAQVLGVGPRTKKVRELLDRLLEELGPELAVLRTVPLDAIDRVAGAPFAEAVRRVRCGELEIAAGYDGEFGSVQIFAPGEQESLAGQLSFFGEAPTRPATKKRPRAAEPAGPAGPAGLAKRKRPLGAAEKATPSDPLARLDDDQRRAAISPGPLLIVAGPGSGKTRTLVARIAHQVASGAVPADRALAVAFTRQAAAELEERILVTVPGAKAGAPLVTTFHGLGLSLLTELGGAQPELLDEEQRLALLREAAGRKIPIREGHRLLHRISLVKQSSDPLRRLADEPEVQSLMARYQELLEARTKVDMDDLVLRPFQLLATDPNAATRLAERWSSISVDEYQDVNDVQAGLLRLLSPTGAELCAIGDPKQAIYGFRGAEPGHFDRFADNFEGVTTVTLGTSYRLTDEILAAARAVIGDSAALRATDHGPSVELVDSATADSEAEQILIRLEKIIGGSSYFAVDSGRGSDAERDDVGFGDIAVLTRTRAQRPQILAALERSGIPCHPVADEEPHDPRSQKVAVMTMHAAKGREFEVVFVTGVERGLLPLEREGTITDEDEERRLLYVAMTRARRLLVLSWAARRTLWGRRLPGEPSPFLAALAEQELKRAKPKMPKKKRDTRQMKLF